MEEEEKFDLIEQYLRNELAGKQLAVFEERLQNDAEFQLEVELQRKLVLAIKEAEIINILHATYLEISKEKKSKTKDLAEMDDFILASKPKRMPELDMVYKKIQRQEESNYPEVVAIKYEGNPFPPFRIFMSAEISYFKPVEIYAKAGPEAFHYQFKSYGFDDTRLLLYGDFNPQKLTLIYYTEGNEDFINLRIESKEYTLHRNMPIAPLSE